MGIFRILGETKKLVMETIISNTNTMSLGEFSGNSRDIGLSWPARMLQPFWMIVSSLASPNTHSTDTDIKDTRATANSMS
jgi:hypothetical protein